MISKKEMKIIAGKQNKKIGKDALKLLDEILKEKIEFILKRASRAADFAGRSTIKKEDLKNVEQGDRFD